MNRASAVVVRMYCCQAAQVAGSLACKCRSEMNSIWRQAGGASRTGQVVVTDCADDRGAVRCMSDDHSLLDHQIVHGHVIVVALATGCDCCHLVHDFLTRCNFAKHGISPTLG